MQATGPICDIVLLVYNNLLYTKDCIESILKNTNIPSRLIIVDNASEDEVRNYLKAVKPSDNVDITLILNNTNEGYAKGMNIGIKESSAKFICLLNNDILVTPGWLNNMIEIADKNPNVGAINPESNNFGKVPPSNISIDDFSKSLQNFKGRFKEMGQCIGFCMLIRRDLVDQIGLLNEDGLLFFEDTDYSYRLKEAGFKCVISLSSYVYHHTHQSVKKLKNMDQIFKESQKRFHERWGKPQRIVLILRQDLRSTPESLEAMAQKLSKLLLQNNFLYIICRKRSTEEQLEKMGLFHANLAFLCYKRLFSIRSILKILFKRKKRFNLIIARDPHILNLLKRLSFIHKTTLSCSINKELEK